ncbi:hypothetical protein swp_1776 [Shewanella piezotolerans WP3]|uniref:Uncharacterized protein n=1 Tax=Shewanella piezotolerans (strain WP3 / JCM 13877) TaxID=225849 RepID=B8CN40_SHEPW|nr:hypothetical protein swp_1776 [Shewanella piezotolerans WP3]
MTTTKSALPLAWARFVWKTLDTSRNDIIVDKKTRIYNPEPNALSM